MAISALAAGRQDRMLCYAFDLLHLDGYGLHKMSLIERAKPTGKPHVSETT